ncbi:MAG: hypothetical protein ACRD96_05600 [Bryobacteraceae bacterium]
MTRVTADSELDLNSRGPLPSRRSASAVLLLHRNVRFNPVYRALVRPLSALLLTVVSLLACESTTRPVPPVYSHDVTPETGTALAALGAGGRFHVEPPATGPGQLSIQEATAQTLQFARYVTNNGLLRSAVGYGIEPHLLTICPKPAYYVNSQLGEIAANIPVKARESIQQRFGPQWLIVLCGSEGEPQMVVQAAIDGNSIRFVDGEPANPEVGVTTAWFPGGVPLNWPDALLISRERAVRFVYETLGVRVTEVPQLFFRGNLLFGRYEWLHIGSAKSCNRWRVVLETEVTLRSSTTGISTTSDTVYVGSLSCRGLEFTPYFHVPVATQGTTVLLDYLDGTLQTIAVPVVSPIQFEIVVVPP